MFIKFNCKEPRYRSFMPFKIKFPSMYVDSYNAKKLPSGKAEFQFEEFVQMMLYM